MVNHELTSERRNRKSRVPGSEFVAAGLFAGAFAYGTPPGIETILFEDDQILQLPCDENAIVVWDIEESQPYQLVPGSQKQDRELDATPGLEAFKLTLEHVTARNSSIETHLSNLVDNISMPRSWLLENVEQPTSDCKEYALNLMQRLHDDYEIIPFKVTMTKDGGIFIAYRSGNKNVLRVVIDNDLDAVAVVSDGKSILESGVLEGDDLEESIIDAFKCSTMVATLLQTEENLFPV